MAIPDPVRDSQFYQGVTLRRFTAFVIDAVLIAALSLVAVVVFGIATLGIGFALSFLVIFATGFFYRFALLARRSATIGMLLTGIEIRTATGAQLDRAHAFVHTAGYTVTLFFAPLMLIGWFLCLSDPHRRLMHDLPFGTVAINRPV